MINIGYRIASHNITCIMVTCHLRMIHWLRNQSIERQEGRPPGLARTPTLCGDRSTIYTWYWVGRLRPTWYAHTVVANCGTHICC